MEQFKATRIKTRSYNPRTSRRTGKSGDNSGLKQWIQWFFIIPIVWLLIFACSTLSAMGAGPPLPMDLLSKKQADYSPWRVARIQPLREGFLEDIKRDFIISDQALSVFTQPILVTDTFIKKSESKVQISAEGTATSAPTSSFTSTDATTDGNVDNPTSSPTPSPTLDLDSSPTASLTSTAMSTSGSTSSPTPSSTPTPSPTPSPSPSPSPSSSPSPSPSPTPSPAPTQSITICDPPWSPDYDYLHAHTPYSSDTIFGYIVHAMPTTGPETEVVITDVTIHQDGSNPDILMVNQIHWYHTGMGSTSIDVHQRSETVHVSTNLAFYACYAAGQCDHSLYGGFIEAAFDDTLNGIYDIQITVHFPEFSQTCTVSKGITTN